MALTVKSKYGLAAMFELALEYEKGPIQIRSVSERRCIPQKYLEQVLVELKRAGLLISVRGKQGGYLLAKAPEDIVVYDIIRALEGEKCLSDEYCGGEVLKEFWRTIDQQSQDLFNISLLSLVNQQKRAEKVLTFTI